MREILLYLPKAEYAPGERVEGHVVVNCDEDFDCESVSLTFACMEQSRVVVGSGKHRRVYLEQNPHFEQFRELVGKSRILEGETRYEFAFDIPMESLSSYEGLYSFIRYNLNGKIEVKWALDPKLERTINVTSSTGQSLVVDPQMISETRDENGAHLLSVEAEKDTFQKGDEFRFRFLVGNEPNIRGARTELIHREHVSPKGRDTSNDNILDTQYWEEYRLSREVWMDVVVRTDEDWPRVFTSELINCMYVLKVTLDVPWRIDRSIEIPLRVTTDSVQDEFGTSIFDF